MKTLARRLVRFEERFTPVRQDYIRNPRVGHRVVISRLDYRARLENVNVPANG